MRATVIGGGIAGLSAGIALQKAGYETTLYEQAPSIQPMGAALSTWGNAMAGLDWLGCGEAIRNNSAPLNSAALRSVTGRTLFGPVDIAQSDSWLPTRSHLQAALLEKFGAANCRFGSKVEAMGGAHQRLAEAKSGEPLPEADLVVVADGINSEIALDLLGNPPAYRGYGGALGLASIDTDAMPYAAEEYWGDNERFGQFNAGSGLSYWFYMRGGRREEWATIGKDELLERSRGWPDTIGNVLAATAPGSVIPLAVHAKQAPSRLGKGKVICIGDAAHAMEPNQGQGACQGIEDAWALGVLAQHYAPEEILPQFEKWRLPRLRAVMRDSMLVGRAIHSPRGWERGVAQAAFAATPQWVDRWQLTRRLARPDYR